MMELTDIYEVAVLRVLGYQWEDIVLHGDKYRFRFPDTVAPVIRQFYEGKVEGDLEKYMRAIQATRSVIFGMKKQPDVEVEGRPASAEGGGLPGG